jgi:transcriptional regulator with XRE-family HTH domain
MALNIALKLAILSSGQTQTDIARKTGLTESRLSRIIRGHGDPTNEERRLIARALRSPMSRLFPVDEQTEGAA